MLEDVITIRKDIFADELPAEKVYDVLAGEDDFCVCEEENPEILIEI